MARHRRYRPSAHSELRARRLRQVQLARAPSHHDSDVHDNARAVVGIFGCDSGGVPANPVALGRDPLQSNAFPIDLETSAGCLTPIGSWAIDAGGNICGTPSLPAACKAVSSSLAPISGVPLP